MSDVNGPELLTSTLECPSCGGVMHSLPRKESFQYEGTRGSSELEVMLPVWICAGCEASFYDGVAEDIKHDAVCHFLGLLTPGEVRGIRDRLGLSVKQLADITGLGAASIKRWESGSLLQNASSDNLLRLVSIPTNVDLLKRRMIERVVERREGNVVFAKFRTPISEQQIREARMFHL